MGEWKSSTIEQVCKHIQSGGTPNTKNSDFYKGQIPFVMIEDITASRKYLTETNKKITDEGLSVSSSWLVPVDSILYSIYATLGVAIINKVPVATNQAILNLIPNGSLINTEYFYYYLNFIRNEVFKFTGQTTQSNLSASIVRKLILKLPSSLTEQTRIAQILSKADEAIAHTEALVAKYQRIKTGLMQDLLTCGIDENGNIRSEETHEFKNSPLGRIPVEWEYVSIGDVLTLQRGFDITGKLLKKGDVPVISSSGITNYHNEAMVNGPGVITGRKGTLGKVYFVDGKFWPHDTTLWVKDFKGNDPKFIFYLLESCHLEKHDAATANPTLNRNYIHPLKVVFPVNLNEQVAISSAIFKYNDLIQSNTISLAKLHALKRGLMQDLLSGPHEVSKNE